MNRVLRCACLALLSLLCAASPPSLDRSLRVPLDYAHPAFGSSFMLGGLESSELRNALRQAEPYRWHE